MYACRKQVSLQTLLLAATESASCSSLRQTLDSWRCAAFVTPTVAQWQAGLGEASGSSWTSPLASTDTSSKGKNGPMSEHVHHDLDVVKAQRLHEEPHAQFWRTARSLSRYPATKVQIANISPGMRRRARSTARQGAAGSQLSWAVSCGSSRQTYGLGHAGHASLKAGTAAESWIDGAALPKTHNSLARKWGYRVTAPCQPVKSKLWSCWQHAGNKIGENSDGS